MAGFRDWIRRANEPVPVPAAPTPVPNAGEMVEESETKPIKRDEHFKKLQLEEIRDVCEEALDTEGEDVDWWDVANTLVSLSEDLLEEMEYEFEQEEEE